MGTTDQSISRVTLDSSDRHLVSAFHWAREQALAYAFSGDPVGDWYEASLPGRSAFCMRDVAHQSVGAHVLGLQGHNRNMLRRFAENIAASRDWCTYWEISKDNRPHPVDYISDADFWYNLPANFDLLDCCYRQYLWSGDPTYIDDPIFLNFYDRTVTDYVKAWDSNGDGLLEHLPQFGRRGIGTYNEDNLGVLMGGDLLAAQYAGYIAYAEIQKARGASEIATEYLNKAAALKELFNTVWWDEQHQRFYGARLQDGTFYLLYHDVANYMTLYFGIVFGIVADGVKTASALDDMLRHGATGVEGKSHLPEILYKYGRTDAAYAILLELADPAQKRREYPEVSYSVVGTIASMVMGIRPDQRGTISTRARLTDATEWIRMENVPVQGHEISILHRGGYATSLVNHGASPLFWRASFIGHVETVHVGGQQQSAMTGEGINGQPESSIMVEVGPGESRTVSTK